MAEVAGRRAMTEPTGRCFISYRRENAAGVAPLVAALHDVGVPVWQDLNNLGEAHTATELRAVLGDPSTACAVLWITPQVEQSSVIREIEAPEIHRRAEAGDGFFFLPVAAGGLSYREAARVLGPRFGAHDLDERNVARQPKETLTSQEALGLAGRVLRSRLAAIHSHLPAGEPLLLRLDTRQLSPFVLGTALSLDWSARFPKRRASASSWGRSLLPALRTVVSSVRQQAPARSLVVEGLAELPALIAFGTCAPAAGGLTVAWRQHTEGVHQLWSLAVDREQSGFRSRVEDSQPGHRDLAVLVSVTADAEEGFIEIKASLELRGIVRISREGNLPHSLATPGQAKDLALVVHSALIEARRKFGEPRCIHLFAAVPSGLALMIGQLLNTFAEAQTYQFLASQRGSRYYDAVRLHPSS